MDSAAWREAVPGYHYQFPRDHFEHEDFRTEWWYYTGNVFDAKGKRYGFELVFFRQGEKFRRIEAMCGTCAISIWRMRH